MIPTYILLKIIDYLPIEQQLQLFQSSRSLYRKSIDRRKIYQCWWIEYKNNRYDFSNLQFTQYLIQRGFNDWNGGLYDACRGGHMECVQLMIERGANAWIDGLYYACHGGHIECVRLMIERGADDWNWGLYTACRGGHIDCIRLMIKQGATKCDCCKSIESHLKN